MKSKFKFNGFQIIKSLIERSPVREQGELDIKIIPSGYIVDESKTFLLKLEVTVGEKNNRFSANVVTLGIFEFEDIIKSENIDSYFYINAPAILFPYIRAYISALTTLSGLEAINIPVMNLTFLEKILKENTKLGPPVKD